jgi:hypothetical protein
MLEQENVQPHVEIDGGDILNLISYNYLPHPFSQVKRMGGVFFCQNIYCNMFINCGLQTLTSLSFSMWEGGWGICYWFNSLGNTSRLYRWFAFRVSFIFYKFEHWVLTIPW